MLLQRETQSIIFSGESREGTAAGCGATAKSSNVSNEGVQVQGGKDLYTRSFAGRTSSTAVRHVLAAGTASEHRSIPRIHARNAAGSSQQRSDRGKQTSPVGQAANSMNLAEPLLGLAVTDKAPPAPAPAPAKEGQCCDILHIRIHHRPQSYFAFQERQQ